MRKLSAFFALGAFASLSPAAVRALPTPKPPSLSAADKAHVLGDTFTVVKTVKQIPAAVQKALGLPGTDPLSGMTDPGKPFEVGDAVSGKLPFRRLVFAAVNARYCLVYYELGGIAYRHEVALYRLQGGQAVAIWKADLTQQKMPVTLAQLRTAIRQGKCQHNND